jgi:hypothetical protein
MLPHISAKRSARGHDRHRDDPERAGARDEWRTLRGLNGAADSTLYARQHARMSAATAAQASVLAA